MAKGNNAANNNRSNQMNPNNSAYSASRSGTGHSQPALDNRANQLNPNHVASKPAPQASPSLDSTKSTGEPSK